MHAVAVVAAVTMFAVDVESHPADPILGKVVCMSIDGEEILTGSEIPQFIETVLTAGGTVAAHWAAFDMASIARSWPEVRPIIDRAYERGQVKCTMLWDQMLDAEANGIPPNRTYGLAESCQTRGIDPPDKGDEWRCRYGELEGVPVDQWPVEAIGYSLNDTHTLRQLVRELGAEPGGFAAVCERFYYLIQSSAKGIDTDPGRVAAWRAQLTMDAAAVREFLQSHGIVRPDGTRNMAAIRDRMGPDAKRTKPTPANPRGQVITAESECRHHSDPVVQVYGSYLQLAATISRELPIVEAGRIHTRYGWAETGRSTSSNPNLQNMTEDSGARDCFSPGDDEHVFVCVDFSQLELCCLGHLCVVLKCGNDLARKLRSGEDLHAGLAAEIGGKRKLAKAGNFGFPGGMGPDRFSAWARKKYDLDISVQEAAKLRQLWRKRNPDVVRYQRMVGAELERSGGRLDLYRCGRKRGGLSYTEGCNTLFQSLGADVTQTAFIELAKAGYLPSLYVHDEYLIKVPRYGAERAAAEIGAILRAVGEDWLPNCPPKAEPKIGDRWLK